MFGNLLGGLAKAAVGVVTLPVAAVIDVAEATGLVQDSGENHTGQTLEDVVKNLQEAVE